MTCFSFIDVKVGSSGVKVMIEKAFELTRRCRYKIGFRLEAARF